MPPAGETTLRTIAPVGGESVRPGTHRRRAVLTLIRCPRCEYRLEGLPRRYRCPECGFEYDESMFVIYGWARAQDRPSFWRLTLGASSPISGIIGIILLGFIVASFARSGSWGMIAFLAFCVAAGAAQWHWRRRAQQKRGGQVQFAFSSQGASRRSGPGAPKFVVWEALRHFRFRRAGRDLWKLRLSHSRWRFSLYAGSSVVLLGGPWLEGVIQCDRRTAATLRAEIRRRLRAAHA